MNRDSSGMHRPLSRRDFVRSSLAAAALGGVTSGFFPCVGQALGETLTAVRPPVFWLQGMGCTGCSVSILNSLHPRIADVLLHVIRMDFHPTLMADEGVRFPKKAADASASSARQGIRNFPCP